MMVPPSAGRMELKAHGGGSLEAYRTGRLAQLEAGQQHGEGGDGADD